MTYTHSGIIGFLSSILWVQPEKLVEAIIIAVVGTVTALTVRAIWGWAAKKIKDASNSD